MDVTEARAKIAAYVEKIGTRVVNGETRGIIIIEISEEDTTMHFVAGALNRLEVIGAALTLVANLTNDAERINASNGTVPS